MLSASSIRVLKSIGRRVEKSGRLKAMTRKKGAASAETALARPLMRGASGEPARLPE